MLIYGVCAGPSGKLERILLPSLKDTDPNAPVLVRRNQRSIAGAYNSLLNEARGYSGVEGLVLLHDDVEVQAPLGPSLRPLLADPNIGLVGAVGGRSFAGGKWWQTEHRYGNAPDTFRANRFERGIHIVDAVDGLLLALSPQAMSRVSWPSWLYPAFHGYDVEIAARVRRAGLRVATADLEIFHHCKEGWGNLEALRAAELAYMLRWVPQTPRTKAHWAASMLRARWEARHSPTFRDTWETD